MRLLEEAQAWLKQHEEANRSIEVAATQLRIYILERCRDKQDKPAFITKMLDKCEHEIQDFSHKAGRRYTKPAYEIYLDDALIACIKRQAILDFKKECTQIKERS